MPQFSKGQLWQVGDRFVRIGHVGRLLVHHRMVVPPLKRSVSRESFSTFDELQKFLKKNHGVLVENCVTPGSYLRVLSPPESRNPRGFPLRLKAPADWMEKSQERGVYAASAPPETEASESTVLRGNATLKWPEGRYGFLVGRPCARFCVPKAVTDPQNAILRYSRVPLCATNKCIGAPISIPCQQISAHFANDSDCNAQGTLPFVSRGGPPSFARSDGFLDPPACSPVNKPGLRGEYLVKDFCGQGRGFSYIVVRHCYQECLGHCLVGIRNSTRSETPLKKP
jgi:hypothetical protein